MSYETPRIIDAEGRTIRIAHPQIPGLPKTRLTASVSATGTTLTVSDNSGLSDTEWLRVGSIGSERTESVRINAAVTRGTSLTITAVVFDHAQDTEVARIPFDQWRIYGNSTNTTAGATLMDTVNIAWDEEETAYLNTSTEYNFYFVIGYDSNADSEFTYSDGITKDTGWAENTVGKAAESALRDTGVNREKVSSAWIYDQVNDCVKDMSGKLKRWSFLQAFDQSLGAVVRGDWTVAMPSDIEDANSNRSVQGVRIGTGKDLYYKDKDEFESELDGIAQTQVRTQAEVNDTTLEIDNSYDFDDSGSVDVFVSGTKYTITYTGVTHSTTAGVLTGIPASGTGSITVQIPVNTNVWQDAEEGQPKYYGIWDGNLYWWPLPDSSNDNMNATMDYYTKRTEVTAYSDVLEPGRFDAVKAWLRWKLRALSEANGEPDVNDGDYKLYLGIVGDMIRNEDSGQKHRFKYKGQGIKY